MDQTKIKLDEALERVYREHGDRIWWAVLAFAGDREVASDAVAEAFAQALRRGDAIQSIVPWIWRAAFRIAAGELKRRRDLSPMVPERSYVMAEPEEALLSALKKLSPKQRAAIVLHYYADYPVARVAELLGSTPTTVSVHLNRGRKRLRKLLEDNSA